MTVEQIAAGLALMLLCGCAVETRPAPQDEWRKAMCSQPKYQHLERCALLIKGTEA